MSEPKLSDLDRCEHGRHSIDSCVSCPGGQSVGNPYLTQGQRIGTDYAGNPIFAVTARPPRPESRRMAPDAAVDIDGHPVNVYSSDILPDGADAILYTPPTDQGPPIEQRAVVIRKEPPE